MSSDLPNFVFVTLDSCRFDTAVLATIPTIRSIGPLKRAFAPATYTVPAHASFFNAHLPVALGEDGPPYYVEYPHRLWRIEKGQVSKQAEKNTLVSLTGKHIFEGFEQLGYYVLGAGGVSQFYPGSLLSQYFQNFLYYGFDLEMDAFSRRLPAHFALSHSEEIADRLTGKDSWFLFINAQETHYPYNTVEGIHAEVRRLFPKLRRSLNLGEGIDLREIPSKIFEKLHTLQIQALEYVDWELRQLIAKLPRHQDIMFVICGDHGECFGEIFAGRKRWGHMLPAPQVLEVPLVIGTLPKQSN